MPPPISTGKLAAILGVSPRTVQRYLAEGRIEPYVVTPGGHCRWQPEHVREQLARHAAGAEGPRT